MKEQTKPQKKKQVDLLDKEFKIWVVVLKMFTNLRRIVQNKQKFHKRENIRIY